MRGLPTQLGIAPGVRIMLLRNISLSMVFMDITMAMGVIMDITLPMRKEGMRDGKGK